MPALTTTYNFSKPLGPDLFLSGHIVALGANWDELDDLLSGAMAWELRAGGTWTINNSVPQAIWTFDEASAALTIGLNDTIRGILNLRGHAAGVTEGGRMRIYMSADHDATDDYWTVRVNNDDLQIFPTTISEILTLTPQGAMTWTGQLALSTGGSGAGILLAADFQLYRSAANQGTIPDQLIVTGAAEPQIRAITSAIVAMEAQSTGGGNQGAALDIYGNSATMAVNDFIGRVAFFGRNANNTTREEYGRILVDITDATQDAEDSRFRWFTLDVGAANDAMRLSSTGGLTVDDDVGTGDDPVGLFDKYDDVALLRQYALTHAPDITPEQRHANRLELMGLGVLDRVRGASSGFHLCIKPMFRLVAGGIYQNRQAINFMAESFGQRFEKMERQIAWLQQERRAA